MDDTKYSEELQEKLFEGDMPKVTFDLAQLEDYARRLDRGEVAPKNLENPTVHYGTKTIKNSILSVTDYNDAIDLLNESVTDRMRKLAGLLSTEDEKPKPRFKEYHG